MNRDWSPGCLRGIIAPVVLTSAFVPCNQTSVVNVRSS